MFLVVCIMLYGLEVKIISVCKVVVFIFNFLMEFLGVYFGDLFRNNDIVLIVFLDIWFKFFVLEWVVDVVDIGFGMGFMLLGKIDVYSNDSILY